MPKPIIKTVSDHIYWSYANLSMAHAALSKNYCKYQILDYMIRNKIYYGLKSGSMSIRSIYEDERIKMNTLRVCCYCGSESNLSADHMIPKIKGGVDYPENIVWACRSCNSSKNGKDMLEWMKQKDKFPSIFILRRYLKLVYNYCSICNLLKTNLNEVDGSILPFDLYHLPYKFPKLDKLCLYM